MSYRSALAQYLWNQQDRQCYYCGETVDWRGAESHIDHKTAKSRGGTDEASNLCLTCRGCNLSKSALSEGEFKRSLVIRYEAQGAVVRQDSVGEVIVYYPNHTANTCIVKCLHGVYDPMSGTTISEYCSLCNSVCPVTLKELNWLARLRSQGLVKQIEEFFKKIAEPWKNVVKYWWNRGIPGDVS